MTDLLSYDADALPETVNGSTMTLITDGARPQALQIVKDSGVECWANFPVAESSQLSARVYFKTPASWPSASRTIVRGATLGAALFRLTLGGSGQPGNVRFAAAGNQVVASSPINTLSTDTWYRCELQISLTLGTGQMRIFRDDSTVIEWDSGQVAADFGTTFDRIILGIQEASGEIGAFVLDDVLVTDTQEWLGAVDPYTPGESGVVAEWKDGSGTSPVSVVGLNQTDTDGIHVQPDPAGDGRAYVRWAVAEGVTTGMSLRTYFRFDAAEWSTASIEFLSCAAAGGSFPWRVQITGPQIGEPGHIEVVNSFGETVATSGGRAVPLGDWRRVEVVWDEDGWTYTEFDRFEQPYIVLHADIPLTEHLAVNVGHWRGVPEGVPLSVNAFTWSTDPTEGPFGAEAGYIIDPQDVSGWSVWRDGSLVPVTAIDVWKDGALVPVVSSQVHSA